MDVTAEILRNNQIYGASDYTGAHTLSASRSLNYASGPSITRPAVENLSVIPFTFKYQDAVGLFGAENHFVRINVKVDRNFSKGCFEEQYWECAEIDFLAEDTGIYYEPADIDRTKDLTIVNDYEPADIKLQQDIPLIYDPYISVDLKNLKVNNKYIDDWLDVRLYTKDREEHAGDHMYVRLNDFFYIGFHARNTRRLPYNVELTVGEELRSGLPSTECNDTWGRDDDICGCVEEEDWVCAEMTLWTDNSEFYVTAEVDPKGDPNTVNSYQPARSTLQGNECIIDTLSDFLGMTRRGNVGHIPPPKEHNKKGHVGDPCCSTCH
jgi:hypothetical protein